MEKKKMIEENLYAPIVNWLKIFLKGHFRKSYIIVEDTHRVKLSDFIFAKGAHKFFSDYTLYDIKVDITGMIINVESAKLVLVECKTKPIKLLDVGQLLGYSLVVKPSFSFLISPEGISAPLFSLFRNYGRYDILEYPFEKGNKKKILLCKWNINKNDIEWNEIIPPGIL